MAIRHRAAPQGHIAQDPFPITSIQSADPNLPDIPYQPQTLTFYSPFVNGGGLLTAAAPSSTAVPASTTPTSTPSTTTSEISAPATPKPAAYYGLSPGKLTAAIVAPIAFLAIIIPIIVFSCLNRRHKKEAEAYARRLASQRTSREREYMSEKQQKYSAPARPPRPDEYERILRPEDRREPTWRETQLPLHAQQPTRQSLGLFNFELSPPSSPSHSSTHGLGTPDFRFSIARALEMRRSEVAVIEPQTHTSAGSRDVAQDQTQESRPSILRGPEHRGSSASIFDPPPPYRSPRPSDFQAQASLFAPLERIGTQRVADRRSDVTTELNDGDTAKNNKLSVHPQHSVRASNEVLHNPDTYGRVRIASSSITSSTGRISAHNNGPFDHGLPERLSDLSHLSFDTSQWTSDRLQHSNSASVVSAVTDSDESSTRHPHQMI